MGFSKSWPWEEDLGAQNSFGRWPQETQWECGATRQEKPIKGGFSNGLLGSLRTGTHLATAWAHLRTVPSQSLGLSSMANGWMHLTDPILWELIDWSPVVSCKLGPHLPWAVLSQWLRGLEIQANLYLGDLGISPFSLIVAQRLPDSSADSWDCTTVYALIQHCLHLLPSRSDLHCGLRAFPAFLIPLPIFFCTVSNSPVYSFNIFLMSTSQRTHTNTFTTNHYSLVDSPSGTLAS